MVERAVEARRDRSAVLTNREVLLEELVVPRTLSRELENYSLFTPGTRRCRSIRNS